MPVILDFAGTAIACGRRLAFAGSVGVLALAVAHFSSTPAGAEGLGLGLGGLHVDIGNRSKDKKHSSAHEEKGDESGSDNGAPQTSGPIDPSRGTAKNPSGGGDAAATTSHSAGNGAAGDDGASKTTDPSASARSPRGHEQDGEATADGPAADTAPEGGDETATSADSTAEADPAIDPMLGRVIPSSAGHNGNAEHVYDGLPIVDEGGYAPGGQGSAVSDSGSPFRTTN